MQCQYYIYIYIYIYRQTGRLWPLFLVYSLPTKKYIYIDGFHNFKMGAPTKTKSSRNNKALALLKHLKKIKNHGGQSRPGMGRLWPLLQKKV